jgi:antirestriction protein ArdC
LHAQPANWDEERYLSEDHNQIIEALEKGVSSWHQPCNAEHSAGRITPPLRGNGVPYDAINVLIHGSAAIEKGHATPISMTFKQALGFEGARQRRRSEKLVFSLVL